MSCSCIVIHLTLLLPASGLGLRILAQGDSHTEGHQTEFDLMQRLGVKPGDLIESAYIDLLEAHG